MLTKLRLERFKGFQEAELALGPFTLLVGTNASGKSNVRDALRFLHGIARGYSLAEIFGARYGEGGELQWQGIRGGTREASYHHETTFALEVTLDVPVKSGCSDPALDPVCYRVEVEPNAATGPRIVAEQLYAGGTMMFDSHPSGAAPPASDLHHLTVRIHPGGRYRRAHVESFLSNRPVLTQIFERIAARKDPSADCVRERASRAISALATMRFLDVSPEAMRRPSFPGQTVLGDRGENLSSVLQEICSDPTRKEALLQWVAELTPMDVGDFDFPSDQIGRVLVTLIDNDGLHTSAYSASDGTLRFLAMVAALLGPEPAGFFLFEELESGIHPARLYLLLQLIERRVDRAGIQLVATTHSPQLLGLASPGASEYSSLIYRLKGEPGARIRRIVDIPDARRILETQNLMDLHASGWLENAAFLTAEEAAA